MALRPTAAAAVCEHQRLAVADEVERVGLE
jgi:hypothetical protein